MTAKAKTRYPVATVGELESSGRKLVTVKGMEIGLFLVHGSYYAWRNVCPHAAAPVCEGVVCGTRLPSDVYEFVYGKDREILRCPWHGWEFDLTSGQHLAQDSTKLKGYEVELEGEQLYVLI